MVVSSGAEYAFAVVCCCLCLQVNTEIVAIQRVITSAGEAQLKGLIQQQAAKTGSKKAAALLADWANAKAKFWQIVPPGESLYLGLSGLRVLSEAQFVARTVAALGCWLRSQHIPLTSTACVPCV